MGTKFGIFLPNGSNGYIVSHGSPTYLPTYKHNKDITLEAELIGLDFVLSMMKYRGFGGETGYWDACLESFTLMAALAADTKKIGLFPSAAILSVHPAVVARMVATIDDISGGRCGLNIVTGWNKPEYEQMGMWRGDAYYNERYKYARDFLAICKGLWRDGRITFKSDYFDMKDCSCLPKPSREIPIVCAGQSPLGMEYTAEMGDHNFVMAEQSKLKAIVEKVKANAAKFDRQVGTYGLFHLIIADTDAAARRVAEDIVAKADIGAIQNIVASATMDSNVGGSSDRLRAGLARPFDEGNLAFMGFPVIWGSPGRVADEIDRVVEETGVDGVLWSMPDFAQGIRDFGDRVMPKLKCL